MKDADRIQSQLSGYAARIGHDDLDQQTTHAAKVRVIDTLGALIGGFDGEPCRKAREVAAMMPQAHGASVMGTRLRTAPDVAAFVNGTTARYVVSILAAEKAAAHIKSITDIDRVEVEVYERAKIGMGTGEHHWHPDSRETADHSIPYVVAAALVDRRVTPASFADARLWSAELRELLPKIEVVANAEFTAAYERVPVEHRTRVTVALQNGPRVSGYVGGAEGDPSQPKSDAEIEDKFCALTRGPLGAERVEAALSALWRLDEMEDVSALPNLVAFA